MYKYFLKYLNTVCEIHKEEIIIWITHDRNFLHGSYYKIDKDNKLYFCVEKPNEVYQILLQGEHYDDKTNRIS